MVDELVDTNRKGPPEVIYVLISPNITHLKTLYINTEDRG